MPQHGGERQGLSCAGYPSSIRHRQGHCTYPVPRVPGGSREAQGSHYLKYLYMEVGASLDFTSTTTGAVLLMRTTARQKVKLK